MKHRIVIIGTGTEIGKTHVACALARALVLCGEAVVALKPVESGFGEGLSDAARLSAAASHATKLPRYRFSEPVSPHLAARHAGAQIDLGEAKAWADGLDADWQIIETAGGLLSPLGPGVSNLDLARALAPTVLVLVASDRLGVLHDLSATLRILTMETPDTPLALALSAPPVPDASTGTNGPELALLEICDAPIEFPRAELEAEGTVSAAALLLGRLAA